MNPCCCMSLQRGVLILAIIDAVLNIILVALWGLILAAAIAVEPNDPKLDHEFTKAAKVTVIVLCILCILSGVFQIILAIFLGKSARTNYLRGCVVWLWITACLLVLGTIGFIVEFTTSRSASNLISGILGNLYKLYEMWVVFSFAQELRSNAALGAVQ